MWLPSQDEEAGLICGAVNPPPPGPALLYLHDHSEAAEDRLELLLSDGRHSARAAAAITVLPVNDCPPRLRT